MTESTDLLISLSIEGEDGDPTELEKLTRRLRAEIKQLDVDAIKNVSQGRAPDGTKAGGLVDWGNLVVSLGPVVLPQLFGLLKSYIERQRSVPVKLTVKVGKNKIEYDPAKISAEDLDNLIKSLSKPAKK